MKIIEVAQCSVWNWIIICAWWLGIPHRLKEKTFWGKKDDFSETFVCGWHPNVPK